jgi:auxin responsive GH3 family protein
VDHVGAAFANGFVKGIRFLEDNWEEMCLNIRTGHLSDWITHAPLRDAITQRYLHQPDPTLADEIASLCSRKPWDGILRRLWPGARYILTIVTGSMSQYIPILESYGAGLQIVSHMYVSTECAAGINLRPLDPPSCASYALLLNIAYYEFAEIKRGDDEELQGTDETYDNLGGIKLVDLTDVQIGRCYELVVTTFAG